MLDSIGMFRVSGADPWHMPVHRRALQLQGSRLQTHDFVATLQGRQVEVQALEALPMSFRMLSPSGLHLLLAQLLLTRSMQDVPCEMLRPDAKKLPLAYSFYLQ